MQVTTNNIVNTDDGVLFSWQDSNQESGEFLLKKSVRPEGLSLEWGGDMDYIAINYTEYPLSGIRSVNVSSFTGVKDGFSFTLNINGKSFTGGVFDLFEELKAVLTIAFAGKATF